MNIGFVILTWNSEKVIGACLKSILSMKEICSHIVVIDNGSTDKTIDIISKFTLDSKSSLKLIKNSSNLGTTKTRNEGIKYIENLNVDYLVILDSDTVVNYEAFKLMFDEMEQNPQYGIIGPKMVTSGGLVQTSARAFPTLFEKICKGMPIKKIQKIGETIESQLPSDSRATSYPVDYIMSACWLIRPQALKKAGYLDEKIFYAPEDAEYCIRMWKSGYKVAYCPQAQIIHEWQRLSKKKLISKMNWEHIKGLAYMFKKHKYAFSVKKLKSRFPV